MSKTETDFEALITRTIRQNALLLASARQRVALRIMIDAEPEKNPLIRQEIERMLREGTERILLAIETETLTPDRPGSSLSAGVYD